MNQSPPYASEWQAVIGLEVHAQLNTNTKLFCCCPTSFGATANVNTCPVCLGHPGALPVLNEAALEKAARLGLALGARVKLSSVFERKNYFYPDLPKAYQISQLKNPVCEGGVVMTQERRGEEIVERPVELERIQIEEDAGKLIHSEDQAVRESYVDLNRSGTPLLEIVSRPQIFSVPQAISYFKNLRSLLIYLEVSDCNMEEGSLRCDVNVSVRRRGETTLGNRTEIKNMNTFKGIEAALNYELRRQVALRRQGKPVLIDTLLFDADTKQTRPMRSKEEAQDYRYFPDPDLPPAVLRPQQLKTLKAALPELPAQKQARFQAQYALSLKEAALLVENKALAAYFEKAVSKAPQAPKKVCSWLTTEVLSVLNRELLSIEAFSSSKLKPEALGELVQLIHEGKLSGKLAKTLFSKLLGSDKTPAQLMKESGVVVLSDEKMLSAVVEKVLQANPAAVANYRSGSNRVFGFFVGQVMKETKGRANPPLVNQLLKAKLKNPPI